MPAPSRPRGFTGSSSGSAGRPAPNTPMSERQQMALLMQMTSSSASPSSSSVPDPPPSTASSSHGPARSRDRNERGETALHVAAIKGDQDAVKKLLESGMSPNVTDFAGWTPLHEACNHAHYNVALTLVKAGANVNAKGLEDETPLHDAALIGHLKLVKMLVEKGADINAKNRKGKTPIDVAAASVSSYLASVRANDSKEGKLSSQNPSSSSKKQCDSASSGSRPSQQLKKPAEQKKSVEENDDSVGTTTGPTTTTNKEEDDIYEFKATPKDATNSVNEDKSENRKNEKSSFDEKISIDDVHGSNSNSSGAVNPPTPSSGGQTKRLYSDVEGTNDDTSETDDSKRKKRKDSDGVKESNKTASGGRVPPRQEKGSKTPGNSSKSVGLSSKSNIGLERKSPCASPKPITNKSTDSDAETEENKSSENYGNGGPKVPPLKIVIPQQSTSGDMDAGSRNGKNNSARSHAALPYVVASSSNSNDALTADKESVSSRCSSPADISNKTNTALIGTGDEKNSKASSDERAQQRVLRSSHRSGGQGGVDRGSNNSSPQLQSSSPSPAPQVVNETNDTTNTKIGTTSNSSPAAQTQNPPEAEQTGNVPSPSTSSSSSSKDTTQNTVELHPRKRKIRAKQEDNSNKSSSNTTTNQGSTSENTSTANEVHPHDHPFTNCYQMFLNIRKQIEKKQRSLFPIQPRPPQGFKDYLMNRRTYVLAGKTPAEPVINFPTNLPSQMKDLFTQQEKERHKLKMQHIVEKEKLGLTVEQEILRVHGKAARSLACQSVPFSVCAILKDEEVYNMITPEQEEKDRNARSRYNGRLFLSWLQDVDDKWEKIKEAMVLRHHNEAESLHAVQKMDWEWVMKENSLCDYKTQPVIDEQHVPMVHVSDDFDLLPA